MGETYELGPMRGQSLADVLDRILDKGLVIVGDIRVKLADVELLTIQIRLLVCSVDKAEAIGLDWWRTDPRLSTAATGGPSLASFAEQMQRLEKRLGTLEKKRAK